jgi:hypothetical protein
MLIFEFSVLLLIPVKMDLAFLLGKVFSHHVDQLLIWINPWAFLIFHLHLLYFLHDVCIQDISFLYPIKSYP